MQKKFTLFSLLIFCLFQNFLTAQTTITAVSTSAACDGPDFCVDLEVSGFDTISSLQWEFQWDTTLMTYVDNSLTVSLPPLSLPNTTTAPGGAISFIWSHSSFPPGVTLVDGSIPLSLCFSPTGTAGVGSLSIVDGATAIIQVIQGSPPAPLTLGVDLFINDATITITDNEAPTIACIGDITVDSGTPISGLAPTSFSDNCGIDSISYAITGVTSGIGLDDASGTSFATGMSTVTYSVVDFGGNTETCSFNVTAQIPPTSNLEFQPLVNFDCDNDLVTMYLTVNNFDDISSMQFTTAWDTADIKYVSHLDGLPPAANFVTLVTADGQLPLFWSDATPPFDGVSIPDGDTIFSITLNLTGSLNTPLFSFIDLPVLPIEIVSFIDGVLDPSLFTFLPEIITITDTGDPTFTACPIDVTVSNTTDSCGAFYTWVAPTAMDDCDPTLTISSTHNPGDYFPVGNTTVTYTATDDSGNTGTCAFVITVEDDQLPTIICPADLTASAGAGTSTAVTGLAPITNDNCSVASVTYTNVGASPGTGNNDASGTYDVGTTTVTYYVTDDNGNLDSCSFQITVTNIPPPDIRCPLDVTMDAELDSCNAVVIDIEPTSLTDPGAISTITYALTNATTGSGNNDASGTRFNVGTTTVTYTLTDTAGQMISCDFDVVIVDNQLPTIACPVDVTASAGAGTSTTVTNLAPTTSDNCGVATVTYTATGASPGMGNNDASGTYDVGTTDVTYYVTDDNGNLDSCSFQVTVTNVPLPDITCPMNVAVGTDLDSCNAAVFSIAPTTTVDPGAISSITYALTNATTGTGNNDASGTRFNVGTTTVTYTLTDSVGQMVDCSFDVEVTDDQLPRIFCRTLDAFDATLDSCNILVTNNLAPAFSDNCGIQSITYTLSGASTGSGVNDATGLTFPVGTTIVTYIATDVNGNVDSCQMDIVVVDNQFPTLDCPNDTTVIIPFGSTTVVVNGIDPIANDNCGVVATTYTLDGGTALNGSASGTVFSMGTTTIEYFVADFQGNVDSCTFTVTAIEAPLGEFLDCPADVTVNNDPDSCNAVVTNIAPIYLVDPLLVKVEYDLFNINGVTSGDDDASGNTFPIGITTIRYIATDMNNFADTCLFTVTVIDNMAPVWTNCPDTIFAEVNVSDCRSVVGWNEPTPDDNCGVVSIDRTHMPSDTFGLGQTTVTYTAYDASGNSTECSFLVIVSDTEAPAIICPSDFTYTYIDNCQAIVNWTTPTPTDNCPGVSLTSTSMPGDTFDLETSSSVIFLAIDATGLTAQCTFPIFVPDTINPTIFDCPMDTIINTDMGLCTAVYNWTEPSATDNCILASFASSDNPGATFPLGESIVSYTATDAAGNSSICTFKVTVVDNQAPTLTCPATVQIRLDGTIVSDPSNIILSTSTDVGCGSIKLSFLEPSGFDNCMGTIPAVLSAGIANGQSFPPGITTQTYTVSDTSGNSLDCSFDIEVLDLEPLTPTIIGGNAVCLGSDAQFAVTPTPGATYDWTGPTAWTATGPTPVRPSIANGDEGVYTVVCTTTEGCTSTGSVTLSLLPSPSIEVSSNSPICTDGGSILQLIAGPASGSVTIVDWLWSGPDNFSSMDQNPVIPNAGNANAGLYTVVGTSASGCTVAAVVNVEVVELPTPSIDSDCGGVACINQQCILLGTDFLPSPDQYNWEVTPAGSVTLPANTNSNEIFMEPNEAGLFIVKYWVSSNGCTSDTALMEINVEGIPIAVNDQDILNYETPFESNVLWNDSISSPEGVEVVLSSGASNGTLDLQSNGVFTYTPDNAFLGEDQFMYQICSTCDPTLCSTGIVTLTVLFNSEECEVPTVITPNGDGKNDALFLNCVYDNQFPTNSMDIYNEWGDRVFQASPYLNNWEGTLDGDPGAPLPDGTYFYIFKTDPNAEAKKGYITIFR